MLVVLTIAALPVAALLALQLLRLSDRRAEGRAQAELRAAGAISSGHFDPASVQDLPDPARRYFLFAIQPGARLRTVAEIEMGGEISLGVKEKPNYLPMKADQVIAGPAGFVWRLRAGTPRMWLSGSDGYARGRAWTGFWLYGLIPIVRAGGSTDFARSAEGRALAESVFWAPATMLPSAQVKWFPVDAVTARAVVTLPGREHVIDLTVAPDGRPLAVLIQRWSRENPERQWRLQPFGGTIGEVREVDGYRVAWAVDGGNWFGTDQYFPFYRARVSAIRFR
ncbi:MAG TPA: DUF6544 family protein [Phenylobacterium sp.]|uniref:DUF6544 family protein n=1 Tax=Phenylobacterium sp. TaxID=1871053 RepID=UPI002F944BB6